MRDLIADGISEQQKALMAKHGTPAGFAQACYELVPGTISMDEAKAAIEKYQREWDTAGGESLPATVQWVPVSDGDIGRLARFCDVRSPHEEWSYGIYLGQYEGGFVCEHSGGEQEIFNVCEKSA